MTGMASRSLSSCGVGPRGETEAEPRYPVLRSYISQRKVSTASSTPAYPGKRLILASRPVLHPLIPRVKLLAVATKRRKGSISPLLPVYSPWTISLCVRKSIVRTRSSRLKTHRGVVSE